ncbi:MAG: homocysteine S-methyltransferase family protein [Actinomycetota bacterium]
MTRYDDLIARVRAGEPILIDGGTGSEALERGAPTLPNGWSGGAVITHPELVRDVHLDYLATGAELIASCTFATGKNVLEDAGVGDHFESVNRRAVELAIEARSQAGADGVLVAGGVSNWSFSGDRPAAHVLHRNTVEQATIMRDAGADLISLEMMVDIDRMTTTLDAVSAVGLPIWVGFSVGPEEGHDRPELADPVPLSEGDLVVDAVRVAAAYDLVDAMFLMHSDVRLTEPGIEAIRSVWDGPLGAYAHAADPITPEEYAAYVPSWQAAGATVIGGCCGIGPDHMRLVAELVG